MTVNKLSARFLIGGMFFVSGLTLRLPAALGHEWFGETIVYGNFTVTVVMSDLSEVPVVIADSLDRTGLARRVTSVIITPTAWASDAHGEHTWIIIDTDGDRYESIDPFIDDGASERVSSLDDQTSQFVFRSEPGHTFAPNEPNPLLVFFSRDLHPIARWERVIFVDHVNGFQVELSKFGRPSPRAPSSGGEPPSPA